jgi:hypothetical protein
MPRHRSTAWFALRIIALATTIACSSVAAATELDSPFGVYGGPFGDELPTLSSWFEDELGSCLAEPRWFDPATSVSPLVLSGAELISKYEESEGEIGDECVEQVGYLYVEKQLSGDGSPAFVPGKSAAELGYPNTSQYSAARTGPAPRGTPAPTQAYPGLVSQGSGFPGSSYQTRGNGANAGYSGSPGGSSYSQRAPAMLAARTFTQEVPGSQPQIPSSRARSSTANSPADSAASPKKEGETYGKKPEDPATVQRQQFLRTQSPLLKKGDIQFDIGVAYTLYEFNFPAVDATSTLVRGDLRRRTLIAPLAMRYGLNKKTQLFLNVPVGWRNTELATSPFTTSSPVDESSSYGGFGDVTLGFTRLLRSGTKSLPDVVFTLSGGLGTGEKSVLSNATQGGLGSGFGSLGGQLTFIHTYDPFVVYWGGGYNHYFAGHIEGIPVQLGDQFSYQLGTGFAINDRVTLSSGLIGAYILGTEVNDRLIKNTQQEPLRFRSAVTLLRNKKIIEPFVEIGLTQTSPAFRTGVTWTF